jgi:hypothetical protein
MKHVRSTTDEYSSTLVLECLNMLVHECMNRNWQEERKQKENIAEIS